VHQVHQMYMTHRTEASVFANVYAVAASGLAFLDKHFFSFAHFSSCSANLGNSL